ncbi:MAG: hypothetical protein ABSG25_06510 [Bryobacteraceae bacterium]
MANKVLDFQKQLLTDDAARKAFAANPAQYLQQNGITLPANVTPPASIPLNELETQVASLQQALTAQHMDISDLPVNNPSAMTRFIEGAGPRSASDLKLAQGLMSTTVAQQDTGIEARTVSPVALAVVVVTVAGDGDSLYGINELVRGVSGIEGISRAGSGYTLHGPGGTRVEGLDSAGVVSVIKGLR